VWPFPGKGYALFLILLLILVAVHLLQLLMFRTVYATQLQWRRGDSWHIIIFGIVGWMTILHAQPQRQAPAPNS
jgi:putative membrane protein